MSGTVRQFGIAPNIRPRRKPGEDKSRALPARGFAHPLVKALVKASLAQGYATRNGTLNCRKLAPMIGVSWRMLYYASTGANISLRALDQWGDLVGVDIVGRSQGS